MNHAQEQHAHAGADHRVGDPVEVEGDHGQARDDRPDDTQEPESALHARGQAVLDRLPAGDPPHEDGVGHVPRREGFTVGVEEERTREPGSGATGAVLDRDGVATILGADGAPGVKSPRTMGFSFTRRDSDPDRARSDLAAAVEIIAASDEVEQALADATERLERDCTDEAWQEQQRLIAAQQGLRQRLASLAGTD